MRERETKEHAPSKFRGIESIESISAVRNTLSWK